MKTTAVLTIVLLFQLGTPIAWGAEFQILTVEEPPSSYRSATGELQGLAIDIVRAIQEHIGNHDPVQIVPEVRALKIAAESSNVVLVGFSRIPEREQHFNWILLYLRKPWVLYARTGESFAIHSLEDAKDVDRIGVVRRDVRELYLEERGFRNLARVNSHEQNVRKALAQRIPMFVYDPVGLAYICRKLDIALEAFQEVLVLRTSEVYIMMSRKGTAAEDVDQWEGVARSIKRDGSLQQIADRWVGRIARETGVTCVADGGVVTFSP